MAHRQSLITPLSACYTNVTQHLQFGECFVPNYPFHIQYIHHWRKSRIGMTEKEVPAAAYSANNSNGTLVVVVVLVAPGLAA